MRPVCSVPTEEMSALISHIIKQTQLQSRGQFNIEAQPHSAAILSCMCPCDALQPTWFFFVKCWINQAEDNYWNFPTLTDQKIKIAVWMMCFLLTTLYWFIYLSRGKQWCSLGWSDVDQEVGCRNGCLFWISVLLEQLVNSCITAASLSKLMSTPLWQSELQRPLEVVIWSL